MGKLVNGWNLSGVTIVQDGTPLTITDTQRGNNLRLWPRVCCNFHGLNSPRGWEPRTWQLPAAWKPGWAGVSLVALVISTSLHLLLITGDRQRDWATAIAA